MFCAAVISLNPYNIASLSCQVTEQFDVSKYVQPTASLHALLYSWLTCSGVSISTSAACTSAASNTNSE